MLLRDMVRAYHPAKCRSAPLAPDKTVASVPCAIFRAMVDECEHERFNNGYGKRFTRFVMPARKVHGCSLDSIEQGLKMIEAIALRPDVKRGWWEIFGLFLPNPWRSPLPMRQPHARLNHKHDIEITLSGNYWAFPIKELESAIYWHVAFVARKERRRVEAEAHHGLTVTKH